MIQWIAISSQLELILSLAFNEEMNTMPNKSFAPRAHPRTVGWFGTTSVAMGGINQSLFLLSALFIGQGAIPGQGSAAVVLLGVGLLLSWVATPGWTELILMYPNRVGGIAATCAEAFRPYSPILANLTGVCYWWGWVPTCGLTALLASSAINQWYLPWFPVPLMATCIVLFFTFINLCGVKWVMRLAMPIATASATLAFLSAVVPIFSATVDWQQAFTFHLTVPFGGWFGQVTSVMAGLYLIGFAAPAFEQAACHVGETIDPHKNVPRAMFASAGLATLYFIVLPIVWLGALGPEPMGKELAVVLGPTFAPLLGGAAKATAIWFMVFNMFHGTIAALAGASRTLAQLSEDGLLPEFLAKRSRTDAPWTATLLTAGMAIAFLLIGDPVWLIAAANLTYLIGIALPSVAVWLLRRNEPQMARPYRAPRSTIRLGLFAAGAWALTAILGFQQFGLPTVLIGIAFAYSGSVLYAWRKFADRRKAGLPGIARTLHLKLTGAMLVVLLLDAFGYLIAVGHVPTQNAALIVILEDTFVVVALLTFAVGLILPGMIAHSAVEVSKAAEKLVKGTLADFTRAMRALAAGDLDAAKAHFDLVPVVVHSRDEVGDMALSFNRLQDEIGFAATGLEGAREGLSHARREITETNERLRLTERKYAEAQLEHLRNQHEDVLNSVSEGVHWINLEGQIVFENPAAARMLGYEVFELIGRPAHLTMHHTRGDGTAYPQCDCPIYTTLKDGVVRRVQDEVFWRKDGSSFPVDYGCTPIRDEDGGLAGTVVVFTDITLRKQAERELERINNQLIETSRNAGMAEVATNVLHNVGNVLNSVNISSGLIVESVRKSRASSLAKVVILLREHAHDLGEFITNDSRGKHLPAHLAQLSEHLLDDQKAIVGELDSLRRNVEHIKEIVAMQQSYAAFGGLKEMINVVNLVEDSLLINEGALSRHQVEVTREFEKVPLMNVEKHKILQILVNLLRNAKHACQDSDRADKRLRVRVANGDGRVRISVMDNGIGIPPENLTRIFNHGFTTRKEGHGFGLHSGALAAKEMGGSLTVHSDGTGQGAAFTLELPCPPRENSDE
jgi:PAS domain S-box-containing protein